MARYRATIKGQRGEVSRLGTKNSQMSATVNGWDIGLDVRILPDPHNQDSDVIFVYLTPGSNGNGRERIIGEFKREDLPQ